MAEKLKVAIGIATAGRVDQMKLTLRQLERQQSAATRTIVCPATPQDFDEEDAARLSYPVQIVRSERGLCAQRNAILRACGDLDIVIFLDDDYYPAPDYIAQVEALFRAHDDLVIATNQPVLDGATGPGVTHEAALEAIAKLEPLEVGSSICAPTYGGYGCNMSIRLAPVFKHGLQFDEHLPLYGWLEDIDFSRRLAQFGRIISASALRGVHLASKRGRSSGVKVGYSQVANPIYMVRKGSMSFGYAFSQMLRNLAINTARSAYPEPWVDRRGRLRGNLIGLRDLASNRLDPINILSM